MSNTRNGRVSCANDPAEGFALAWQVDEFDVVMHTHVPVVLEALKNSDFAEILFSKGAENRGQFGQLEVLIRSFKSPLPTRHARWQGMSPAGIYGEPPAISTCLIPFPGSTGMCAIWRMK